MIRDGTNIPALGQPWFDQWEAFPGTDAIQLRVADLAGADDRMWDRPTLIYLVGESATDQICRTIQPPAPDALLPDRLIWNGQ
jgi:hypothetical protein